MSIHFIGSLPESLTQELLVGKLLVGGLGVQGLQIDRREQSTGRSTRRGRQETRVVLKTLSR